MKSTMMKRMLKGVLATTMAVALCLSLVVAVNAEGTAIQTSTAAFTKELNMAEGTNTPAATFTFKFDKVTVDGDAATASNMPAIADQSVTYAASDNGSTTAGLKTVKKETGNIFAGVTFPHAGEYVYKVTETPNTYAIADATKEEMKYSNAEYEMHVYVKNGTSGPEVDYVAVIVKKDDEGTAVTTGEKVDPTPTAGGTGNDAKFVNTYIKTKGNNGTDPANPQDPTDPNNESVAISKTVAGDYGDKSKEFSFNLTVQKAVTCTETTYQYVIVDSTGTAGAVQTGTYGTPATVQLKHGEKISLVNLTVGSKYTVEEQGATGYTPSVAITADGAAVSPAPTAAAGANLSTGERLVGENANTAAYTNTYQTVTPTGIIVNNLPYIVMVLLAIGGLAIVAAGKKRKSSR